MKVVKILGVVFGALFLLTGIALLAGSAVFGAGQGEVRPASWPSGGWPGRSTVS